MQLIPTRIPGVIIIEPRRIEDERGFFSETYNKRLFSEAGLDLSFVQDNHSLSREVGVIRGLHFQAPPHAEDKLIRVIRGRILDVAVDIRMGSPTYGRHVAMELSADSLRQLLVPRGFAHGFCCLEPNTEVLYKVTNHYAPECAGGLLWNDPDLAIDWPVTDESVRLSDRDARLPRFAALTSPFVFDTDDSKE
ncbi:MAG TPA: dTDP-4-dehydrorhamnose 3,5-epimerase [Haliangium sp.]|nr:dTDP-4-dehydrorhamnose 3,5-epimerase [Haliangium sp.]